MSTLQVDRISPYQSSSVQIDGDVTFTGAVSTGSFNTYTASQEAINATLATTGSNTFNGDQTVLNGEIQLPINSNISLYEDGSIPQSSAIRFHSGSNSSGTKWINLQAEPGGEGRLAIASFPENNHFMFFDPKDSQPDNQRLYIESVIEGGSRGGTVRIGNGLSVTGSVSINGDQTVNGNQTINGTSTQTFDAPAQNNEVAFVNVNGASIDGRTYNRVYFGIADYSQFGQAFEDYFGIEYYDSLSYNFGSEFNVNGKQTQLSTLASGSGQSSFVQTRDNYDGTSSARIGSANKIEIVGRAELSNVMQLAAQDPLPSGNVGELAVSGSSLYFYTDQWREVAFV